MMRLDQNRRVHGVEETEGIRGGLPASLLDHQAVGSLVYRKHLGLCYERTAVSDAVRGGEGGIKFILDIISTCESGERYSPWYRRSKVQIQPGSWNFFHG